MTRFSSQYDPLNGKSTQAGQLTAQPAELQSYPSGGTPDNAMAGWLTAEPNNPDYAAGYDAAQTTWPGAVPSQYTDSGWPPYPNGIPATPPFPYPPVMTAQPQSSLFLPVDPTPGFGYEGPLPINVQYPGYWPKPSTFNPPDETTTSDGSEKTPDDKTTGEPPSHDQPAETPPPHHDAASASHHEEPAKKPSRIKELCTFGMELAATTAFMAIFRGKFKFANKGFLKLAGIGMASSFAGNAAGQGLGKAFGLHEKFDWKNLGIATMSGAIPLLWGSKAGGVAAAIGKGALAGGVTSGAAEACDNLLTDHTLHPGQIFHSVGMGAALGGVMGGVGKGLSNTRNFRNHSQGNSPPPPPPSTGKPAQSQQPPAGTGGPGAPAQPQQPPMTPADRILSQTQSLKPPHLITYSQDVIDQSKLDNYLGKLHSKYMAALDKPPRKYRGTLEKWNDEVASQHEMAIKTGSTKGPRYKAHFDIFKKAEFELKTDEWWRNPKPGFTLMGWERYRSEMLDCLKHPPRKIDKEFWIKAVNAEARERLKNGATIWTPMEPKATILKYIVKMSRDNPGLFSWRFPGTPDQWVQYHNDVLWNLANKPSGWKGSEWSEYIRRHYEYRLSKEESMNPRWQTVTNWFSE